MTPEHDRALCEAYPQIFKKRKRGDVPISVWGFECGDGWFTLLDALCSTLSLEYEIARVHYEGLLKSGWAAQAIEAARLTMLAARKNVPVVQQVKSKFGGLRFYSRGGTDAHHACIQFAEALSLRTCETCGAPGTRRSDGWIQTLCDVHAESPSPSLETARVSTYDRKFLVLSASTLTDALCGHLSERGVLDASFDAGYTALLGACTQAERASVDHPSAVLVRLAASRIAVPSEPGAHYAATRYSGGPDLPTPDQIMSWAQMVRAAVNEFLRLQAAAEEAGGDAAIRSHAPRNDPAA